jgi:hypothetical protein
MLTCVAKLADVGPDRARRQVQCLGNLPFRPTFPPQTHEHRIALGFGRATIARCVFGSGKRPHVPVCDTENSLATFTSKAPASRTAVKTRKFRLPFSKSTRSLLSMEARLPRAC